jgi:hypothetical protein
VSRKITQHETEMHAWRVKIHGSRRWSTSAASERKVFFFEKKKQKTFACLAAASQERLSPGVKVFWFFFSKKNCFLHLEGYRLFAETRYARHQGVSASRAA